MPTTLSWNTHQRRGQYQPVFPLLHFLLPVYHDLQHMMYTYNLKNLGKFTGDRAFRIIAALNAYLTFLWLVIAGGISISRAACPSSARCYKCLGITLSVVMRCE